MDGRYRVLACIGTGGMGVVYRVEHLHLGKTAAMKVLSPDTARKPEMLLRFRQEAQAVSKLNHPNIVQTFDFGQSGDAFYLVMEYIRGDDLAALLRRDGPWSFERAARFFAQVCSGLTEAHEAGIVHRDLKPENLMLLRRRDGTEHAKVLDFGLAKLRERPDAAGISAGGQVLGTPYYMAPEQVRGEPLDARADVYSLGATFYRVLTGEPPFDAPSPMSVLAKHLTDDVVPPRSRAPGLPPEADRIVLRAMAKSPDDRFSSAAEVQAELERALAALGHPAPSPSVSSLRTSSLRTSSTERPTAPSRRSARRPSRETPTVALEESDGNVDVERLRRADVDDFEWGLRRRRLLWRLVLPIVVLVGGAVAGALLWRGGSSSRGDAAEHEPNNTPGYANLVTSGASIRGMLGPPINEREGDVDYFRIPAGTGARVLRARLEGIPGVDLVLELFDAQGRRLAKGDARGRGQGEWLQPISIGPGEAYLGVREVWIAGVPPSAGAPDPYTLAARWAPPQPGWELEPNDWEAVATPIAGARGTRVRGYLGSPDDRDWFSFTLDHVAKIPVTIQAPAGLDVVVYLDEQGKRVVDRRGPGEGEELLLDVAPGKPALVGIGRKLDRKREPKDQALEALDDSYELKLGTD